MTRLRLVCGQGCARSVQRLLIQSAAMKTRRLLLSLAAAVLILAFVASGIPSAAQRTTQSNQRRPETTRSSNGSQRDEALWQRALAIHRRAIVVDTHNDVTTPMTNDDYDLGGIPPTPYRTSIDRLKQG